MARICCGACVIEENLDARCGIADQLLVPRNIAASPENRIVAELDGVNDRARSLRGKRDRDRAAASAKVDADSIALGLELQLADGSLRNQLGLGARDEDAHAH
ncbi:unannotated protein [freshwater metagenome]|uniref:Unannotated protein n=1 Tax=freshwater metagenome TaxID=449393 RepID=A0A6J7PRG7_9ZZZZ